MFKGFGSEVGQLCQGLHNPTQVRHGAQRVLTVLFSTLVFDWSLMSSWEAGDERVSPCTWLQAASETAGSSKIILFWRLSLLSSIFLVSQLPPESNWAALRAADNTWTWAVYSKIWLFSLLSAFKGIKLVINSSEKIKGSPAWATQKWCISKHLLLERKGLLLQSTQETWWNKKLSWLWVTRRIWSMKHRSHCQANILPMLSTEGLFQVVKKRELEIRAILTQPILDKFSW